MTRTRRHAAVTAVVATLLAATAGCSGDDSSGPDASPTTSSGSAPTSASAPTVDTTPTDPTTPAAPSVTPASGVQLTEASSTVTAPAGWEPMPDLVDYASSAGEKGGLSSLNLVDSGDISGGASLDSLAQATLDNLPDGATGERLDDIELDGQLFLHVHYTVRGDPREYDSLTTVRNGRNVGLDFVLLKKDTATNPDVIASVLATFRWIA